MDHLFLFKHLPQNISYRNTSLFAGVCCGNGLVVVALFQELS